MIRGQGMPSFRHHDFGNLIVQFDVKFPEKNFTTDPAAFEALKAIIPVNKSISSPTPPAETMTEIVDFEDLDASQQARAAGATAMDEDDEDGHPGGGERVQCASQ